MAVRSRAVPLACLVISLIAVTSSNCSAWVAQRSAMRALSSPAPSVATPAIVEQGPASFASSIVGVASVAAAVALAAGASAQMRRQHCTRTRLSAARLYGSQRTRSPLVNWYCIEAGIPLEMKDPQPSPHPFGQVPHLSDDGGVEVFESGAILQYLADKYGGCDTPEKRAKYSKWIMWANATLDGLCFGSGMNGTQVAAPGKAMDTLENILSKSDWLVDNEFSVADVAVASYLNYVPVFFGQTDMRQRPKVAEYMKRCAARPAFVEAFGDQHAAAIAAQVLG